MKWEQRRWPLWLGRIAYAICALLFFLVLASFFLSEDTHFLPTVILLFLGLSLGSFLFYHIAKRDCNYPLWLSLLCLLLLCFAFKLFWVLYAQIEPMGDYSTFWGYAKSLSQEKVLSYGRDMALFPHLFGYSFFLSLFGSLFGFSSLLAPVLNVVLSTISCGLIFFLGNRLLGRKAAFIACLLWIFFPSQTIYNMYVLSEPLYTTGILLFLSLLALFFPARRATHWKAQKGRAVLFGVLCGCVLTVVNMTRPIGAIFLIGLFLWLLFLRPFPFRPAPVRWNVILFSAVLLATYILSSGIGTMYLEQRIGEEAASVPGYNIYVGLNEESDGRWNQEDSDRLASFSDQPGTTAPQAQSQMISLAKERWNTIENLPGLLWDKFTIFLGHDDACVGYGSSILRHTDFLSVACNSFYLWCCLLALFGTIAIIQKGDRSPLFLVMIYFPGLTFAQMAVEVAGRYHYSLLPMITLFAAWGILSLGDAVAPYRGKRLGDQEPPPHAHHGGPAKDRPAIPRP